MGHPPFDECKQQELIRLYNQGIKVRAIASRLNVKVACISRWCRKLNLRRHGVECVCGAILSSPLRQRCDNCRNGASEARRKRDYISYDGGNYGGDSARIPGHEERLKLYTERASSNLPLFDNITRPTDNYTECTT